MLKERILVLSTVKQIDKKHTIYSTYLAYKDPAAKPALRYHIFETIEHKQPLAIAPRPDNPVYPDYKGMMLAHDICNYVDNKNVREVWLFAYQGIPIQNWGFRNQRCQDLLET